MAMTMKCDGCGTTAEQTPGTWLVAHLYDTAARKPDDNQTHLCPECQKNAAQVIAATTDKG